MAQFVDGSMGMAYGVTSSSLLLLAGFSPAAASASLHLAEVATTIASGAAHHRLGNVNRSLALTLALPGAVGAFFGALLLSSIPGESVKPLVSALLLCLGLSILIRFSRRSTGSVPARPLPRWLLTPLGLVGGVMDALGGGGWGPIVTTTLLARSSVEPRTVVGSVNISESAVAIAATLGFALSMGINSFQLPWVLALMIGGALAAPLAAWIVGRVPQHILGISVGGVILLTNLRTLAGAVGASTGATLALYMAAVAITAAALTLGILRRRSADTWAGPAQIEHVEGCASAESRKERLINLGD